MHLFLHCIPQMVIVSQYINYQINVLYSLNSHNIIIELYVNFKNESKQEKW